MLAIRRILFPTDFSECAEGAFAHAAALASQYGAELHVLHVVIWPVMIPSYGLDTLYPAFDDGRLVEQLKGAAEEQIQSYLGSPLTKGVRVFTEQVSGDAAAPAILAYADERDIDLIVMGTHGRRGIRKWMMGSVVQEVVRRSECPVFTVTARAAEETVPTVRRILAPVDFSEQAEPLVSYAKMLAEGYGAELDLLHVVAHVNLPLVYGVEAVYPGVDELMNRSTAAIRNLAETAGGPDVPIRVHVVSGDPAQQILEFAESHDTGLIIIATHGFTGVERLLLGSVAEKVVRAASHPVFTVKSFGKSLLPTSYPRPDDSGTGEE